MRLSIESAQVQGGSATLRVFTLGLLPSGPGRDGISIATLGAFAIAVGAISFFLARRKQGQNQTDGPDEPDQEPAS